MPEDREGPGRQSRQHWTAHRSRSSPGAQPCGGRSPATQARNIDRAGAGAPEVTDWLDAAEARGGSAYACVCLLALNGLRVGELCCANMDDLAESTWHHTITLRAEAIKGGKAAVAALAPRTVQAISLAREDRQAGALRRNQHGRRMPATTSPTWSRCLGVVPQRPRLGAGRST